MNLEHLGRPKYQGLLKAYELPPMNCSHHHLHFSGESDRKATSIVAILKLFYLPFWIFIILMDNITQQALTSLLDHSIRLVLHCIC